VDGFEAGKILATTPESRIQTSPQAQLVNVFRALSQVIPREFALFWPPSKWGADSPAKGNKEAKAFFPCDPS
jgi:hypothetical protein